MIHLFNLTIETYINFNTWSFPLGFDYVKDSRCFTLQLLCIHFDFHF